MPRLRQLSGDEVLALLGRFGFAVHSQRGSHVKLRRFTRTRRSQSLTVPRHSNLDVGPPHAIFRQASRFVPEEDLWPHFYTK